MRPIRRHRRGAAAVLAMLYLVLFSVLAVGFYSATNSASQVSTNENRVVTASLAAESGMDFIRYQMAQVVIPPKTPQAVLFDMLYTQLSMNLQDTPNFAGKSLSRIGSTIMVPATGCIDLDHSGGKFRATIEDLGQKVRVKVWGMGSNSEIARAVQVDYDLAERASRIFDYGVASRGKVYTDGASRVRGATDPTKGSVLSTCWSDPTPIIIKGKEVSGDISVTNPNGGVLISGATVGGTNDTAVIYDQHVHKGVDEPEFPTIDNSKFLAYVTDTYVAGKGTYSNVRIPANTNPVITAGTTFNGVLYIESPNYVSFGGNVNINGTIIVQDGAATDVARNVLDFTGNVSATGVETLDPSFGDLRKLTGSFILAPGFHLKFSGNFHTVDGSIVGSKISMTGNAGGTINGTVMNVDDYQLTVSGSSEIIIASTGTSNYPAGVVFSSHYVPLPDTYEEVQP